MPDFGARQACRLGGRLGREGTPSGPWVCSYQCCCSDDTSV